MVAAVSLGTFYGSELPRPTFYTPPSGGARVDPPEGINQALLEWAAEASWNMGGLNTAKRRTVGRIEGNVAKLRKEAEKARKRKAREEKKLKKGSKRPKKGVKVEKDASDEEDVNDELTDEEDELIDELANMEREKVEMEEADRTHAEEEDEEGAESEKDSDAEKHEAKENGRRRGKRLRQPGHSKQKLNEEKEKLMAKVQSIESSRTPRRRLRL